MNTKTDGQVEFPAGEIKQFDPQKSGDIMWGTRQSAFCNKLRTDRAQMQSKCHTLFRPCSDMIVIPLNQGTSPTLASKQMTHCTGILRIFLGSCDIGYPPPTPLKVKSHKILFAQNLLVSFKVDFKVLRVRIRCPLLPPDKIAGNYNRCYKRTAFRVI